ncbi:MAG: peptidoglycan endopeptidase [Rhodocyclaceae bacterium]|nr:peptidoglycan endopeptidase [Rhodocyclaceae bacterium]
MRFTTCFTAHLRQLSRHLLLTALLLASNLALADESVQSTAQATAATVASTPAISLTPSSQLDPTLIQRASTSVQTTLDSALDLIGIRYKRGGNSPETGFDCSGFVRHVFKEGMGIYLPRSSKEIAKTSEEVDKQELQPGDLVFFNTMRRAFSHVGIYLGDNKFVHSPRAGGKVRIEDLRERYWTKRFNGARRVAD